MQSTLIITKTIRVMGPSINDYDSSDDFDEANDDALSNIDWDDMEDDVNYRLPEGFYCKIEG